MTPLKGGLIGSGITAVVITAIFLTLYFIGCGRQNPEPRVKDETTTKTTHNPLPTSINPGGSPCGYYKRCADSDFDIQGKFRTGTTWFDTTVTDYCKTGKKSFKMEMPYRERPLSVQLMPFILGGWNSAIRKPDIMLGGQLTVLKNYGLFSIGGSGIYEKSIITKDWYAGAGAVFGFNP